MDCMKNSHIFLEAEVARLSYAVAEWFLFSVRCDLSLIHSVVPAISSGKLNCEESDRLSHLISCCLLLPTPRLDKQDEPPKTFNETNRAFFSALQFSFRNPTRHHRCVSSVTGGILMSQFSKRMDGRELEFHIYFFFNDTKDGISLQGIIRGFPALPPLENFICIFDHNFFPQLSGDFCVFSSSHETTFQLCTNLLCRSSLTLCSGLTRHSQHLPLIIHVSSLVQSSPVD